MLRGSLSKSSLRAFSNAVENLDNLKNVKLPWPNQPGTLVNFRYYDSTADLETDKNELKTQKVILASHGSPGSHNDFKYMVPHLVASGFRVIAINWPGYGVSDDPPDKNWRYFNYQRAELLNSFVEALNITKFDAVVGHSAGCYPLPLLFTRKPNLCSNAFFIAPGSASPYRAIRPYWMIQFIAFLLNSRLKLLVCRLISFVTSTFLGFKYKHYTHANGLVQVVANIDFPDLNLHIAKLKDTKRPPIVLLIAENDAVVEKAKSIEYAEKLDCGKVAVIPKKAASISEVLDNSPLKFTQQHRAIMFEGEGHFLQKHRADAICKLISDIIDKRS